MASKTQSGPPEVLFLPVEMVKASPGFSFDVGSSLIKVIYRSKEDFRNGEPITEQAVVGCKARVRLTTLSRDLGPAALVQLMKEKVDLDLSGSHRIRISSTGTGSNFWQPEIESQLNIELDIGMEDVYFSEGFQYLAENLPGEEFAYPPSQAGLEAAQDHKELMKNWQAASGKVSVDEYSKLTNLQHRLPEGAKPFLPSLLVMCGSNFLFVMMTENGELVTVDGITLGGKTLSAFGSYILGTQSFSEMMQAIEQADGYSCDIWVKETVNLDSSGNYGNMSSTKRVIFPLAKLQDPKQAAKLKKEDIVRSMFRTAIEGLAQMAYLNALAFGVRRIYFLGSFINIPLARELITTELEGRILLRPKDQQVEYSFVRHGGYCGALGAFIRGGRRH